MLPINIIALDERSHFDRLLPMLPLTSTQCVLDNTCSPMSVWW